MGNGYNRVAIKGTLLGGEVWSVNPCFIVDETGVDSYLKTFTELQEWATAITALEGGNVLSPDLLALISSAAAITSIRVEAYLADGTLVQAAEAALVTPVTGSGQANKPLQVALVASLLTGRPGRSYAGRLYWPALGAPLQSATLRLSTNGTSILAEDTASLLTGIAQAAPGTTAIAPVVVSHKLAIQTPIVSVRVGDVLDTQRRRRDSLVEGTSTVPIGG
uniref:Uncharacterized protein n=1 Tax=uncultured prokaryote TaxID=198431 RepID=A0A0H5Q3V0_9ZZZZ|nr:hypothetical protein [uncultured prokaryote]